METRMTAALTKRQSEILEFIKAFLNMHGYAPSLQEIGRQFSLTSLATVHKHLENLRWKGYIKRAWNRSRSITLTEQSLGICPYCKQLLSKDTDHDLRPINADYSENATVSDRQG